MSSRHTSDGERSRLEQIASLDLEAARPSFERIARLVQCVFEAPIAHVGLIEADRLWMAGVSDVAMPTVNRRHAFSETVVRQGKALWVEDTSRDKRFQDNPFVTGTYGFRFYAGAPIRLSNGECVGALSIIDRKPRRRDPFLEARLADFAQLVADDWERRQALSAVAKREAEASAAEQRLRLAMEMAELHVWEVNHGAQALTSAGIEPLYPGVSYDELTNNVWDILHPDDRPSVEALWAAHLTKGQPVRAIARLRRPDDSWAWTALAVEALRDQTGAIERVVIVTRDIDREKRAEEAMGRALEGAEAANRSKSEFLANMSHEIRTPLNGVMGVAGALARTDLQPAQREMVELIEGSAEVLENLLSDVLDIARIESGRLELHEDPFDLAGTFRGVAALFEPKARQKGLAFHANIEPSAEVVVRADATRLRQIASNLLSNAIKFTESGFVGFDLAAAPASDKVHVELVVSDTGIGFDCDFAERLFERFEQADGSITRRYGGTGLGLAISRSLADAMGGGLTARSAIGQGAIFTLCIDLPLAAPNAARPVRARTEFQEILERRMNAPKVLLAEDHPTNRKVVALILEAVGVDLTAVENGLAATEACAVRDFDLILMDIQMPVMDGLSAIRAIREREAKRRRPRTPILALTANAMPEHVKASMDAGADGHLTKPISAATLVEAVREVCEPRAVAEASLEAG